MVIKFPGWFSKSGSPPAKNASSETGWAESLIYSKSNWPKYNSDELIGLKGARVYRKMLQDEQVKAVVRFKRDSIISRRWYFDFDDTAVDATTPENKLKLAVSEKIIDQCQGSFFDSLCGIMSAIGLGFSMTEKVLGNITVDGKTFVGLKKLALKPSETFLFSTDEHGNITKCVQRFEGFEQEIDLNNFIHYVQNPDVDAHYGQSELREAYRAWFSKDMAIRFWNIHLERHASGFLKIQPAEGVELRAGSTEYNTLVSMLNNLNPKTGILLPAGIDAELVMPANTDAFERAVVAHDKSIAKALLVPNLLGLSEQGATGSYSQSQTQLEAFMWTLEADSRRLEDALNEQLFKPLGLLNFGEEPIPKFRFKPLSEALKLQIIQLWANLVGAQVVTPGESDETHIRDLLDFPARSGEVELPGQPELPDETVLGESAVKITGFQRAVKRVDFKVIGKKSDQIIESTSSRLVEAVSAGVDSIIEFVRSADLFKNPDKISEVVMPARATSKIRRVVEAGLKEAWALGADNAKREIKRAAFAVDDLRLAGEAAEKFLESRSYTIAGDVATETQKKIVNVIYNGIKGGWALDEIETGINKAAGDSILNYAKTVIRTTVFEAINEARYELFTSPEMDGFVEALEYSAVLDGKVSEICEGMDGKIYPADDPIWEAYAPPLHFNCRSILIAVLAEDKWTKSDAPNVSPAKGFGGPEDF